MTPISDLLEKVDWVEQKTTTQAPNWQPRNEPVRLAALNYHHITQATFSVADAIDAFDPQAHRVFVQFIDGDYQPYLLDRKNGQLKAVHAEGFQSRILEEGIPAGTYLFLEQKGHGMFRVFPEPRIFGRRMFPGKLARLENGVLHIEQAQIPMDYVGNAFIFLADMSREEIQGVLAKASHARLSLQDAVIEAIQKLSATDPEKKARRSDILNAVSLLRMTSPEAVSTLLENQPCFERLEGDCFSYRPMLDRKAMRGRKQAKLDQLWEDLVACGVPPEPVTVKTSPTGESQSSTAFDRWENRIVRLPELQAITISPRKSSAQLKLAALAAEHQSNYHSPARMDGRRIAPGLRIPARPFHELPTYQRILFSLRGWLAVSLGNRRDQAYP